MNPLIAIDIGNTSVGYALYNDFHKNRIDKKGHILTSRLLDTSGSAFNDVLADLAIKPFVVISSVVPDLTGYIMDALSNNAQTIMVINPADVDTIVYVDNPKTGTDRICTMAGAYCIYKTDLAVVDFGTATTISVVNRNAKFIAGVIMPGIELMLKCLHQHTAQLPDVQIRQCKKTTTIDTESSILNGVICGTAGATERIIKDIEKENGFVLQLILTGGMVGFIKDKITLKHIVDDTLIFEGMRNILLRNLR